MATPKLQPELDNSKALQLHLEEYKALVNRSTALIGQMFTVMGIGFVYLGYVINNWLPKMLDHRPELWPGLLVEQIILLLWLALRHTELGITVYIETTLRSLCEPTPELRTTFWRYRHFVDRNPIFFDLLALWVPAIISGGAFLGVLIYRIGFMNQIAWSKWDVLSVSSGSLLLVGAVAGCHKLKQLKKELRSNPTKSGALSATS